MDISTTPICEIIEIINQNNLPETIMGDMNINLLNFQKHTKTNTYLENILSHGFLPKITMATRIANSSVTLIDHIYTNETAKHITSGVIITDVSDHFGTFQFIQEPKHLKTQSNDYYRIYSDNNTAQFKHIIQNTNFNDILSSHCPNTA